MVAEEAKEMEEGGRLGLKRRRMGGGKGVLPVNKE